MSTTTPVDATEQVATSWRLDPQRSSVEFQARTFWGLLAVKGSFAKYEGTLTLGERPEVALTVEAASLDTGNSKRDEHLRSAHFFDVEHHPQVSFVSDSVTLDGERLHIHGALHAAGREVPVELEATLRAVDDGYEVEASTRGDHRALGMRYGAAARIIPAKSAWSVKGRLVRA